MENWKLFIVKVENLILLLSYNGFWVSYCTKKKHKKNRFHEKKIFAFSGERELRASAQKNVTEEGDDRRWKAYSVLEYVFSQDDFGKQLTCRVNHPAYANEHEEAAVKLDLLCEFM